MWNQAVQYLSFDPALLAEPGMILRLVLQGGLLFGSAFFSGSETALFSVSDVDLEQLRRKHHPRADLLHALLSRPRHLIISILCGNELINIGATANMTGILIVLYGVERAAWINVLIMVPLLLLFGEITPKTISVTFPVRVSTNIVCAPMHLWVRLVAPLRWGVRLVADRVTTWIVGEARDADHLLQISEFRSLVADIEKEGLVSATDRVLIYNLLDAGNTEIEHIMTPRTRIHYLRPDMSVSQVVEQLTEKRRLRMPVYEGSRDNIVGFVHAETVMDLILDQGPFDAVTCRDLLHPPLLVPSTKSVDEVLDFFQANRSRAAVIVNEHGGIAGMVTMEDVLNVIFGEIAGEFVDRESYTKNAENDYEVSGDMKLADFEALTNFGIQDPRMTTIGGVLLRHLGRMPREGDAATVEGVRLVVLEMENNRVLRLRAVKGMVPESGPSLPEPSGGEPDSPFREHED